ncbi:MAG: hypothetical protein OZSIB_0193 [Candidatus Ozemobacter sibiricus]|uniref:Prepilin-type N-terminal cleavage/methylation domain-containing protein n=1 Tax=Candidatus Ozemobacter sibiricus TaxID=2268124 RepID=A0A367ZPL6_9BACT|nr:MAG: hypothetical protein OZSIB_0193 [Candidatus Ozemobacter sibiricus]
MRRVGAEGQTASGAGHGRASAFVGKVGLAWRLWPAGRARGGKRGGAPGHARRGGFTLVEVLISMMILSLVLLGALVMVSRSRVGAMDAWFEFLAVQLALEPIEVFRGFGATWVKDYRAHPLPEFPLGVTAIEPRRGALHWPADATLFEREITLTPVEEPVPGVLVEVRVRPRGATRAQVWLRREEVVMSALLVEQPR